MVPALLGVLALAAPAAALASKPCGPNPGGQRVARDDGSSYPYFGMPCRKAAGEPDSDCGDCYLDQTCTCTAAKCCAPREGPPGYACLPNGTDIVGEVCLAKVEGPGKSLAQLATDCDALHVAGNIGCAGFNSHGFLKRCVRSSCGATPSATPTFPQLVSCVRTDTPVAQKHPKGADPTCHSKGPPPPPGPGPHRPPGGGWVPPYGGGCATTWNRSSCNCSGVHPPFGPPAKPVTIQEDYHFPAAEAAERATLPKLQLVSVASRGSAVIKNLATKETATLSVGDGPKWGWELLHAESTDGQPSAVVEHDFDAWSELRFLWGGGKDPVSMRKPVGRLDRIQQPLFDMVNTIDEDFHCKQDIDPTDWLGRLAANISAGGEEPSVAAANTLMAPNADSGIFGNPEDHNKFTLSHRSVLQSTGDFGHKGSGGKKIWQLSSAKNSKGGSYLPAGCEGVTNWEEVKMGMVGEHLRVLNQGLWHSTAGPGGTGCGVEIIAVAAPPSPCGDQCGQDQNLPESGKYSGNTTALLRVTAIGAAGASNTSYVKAHLYSFGASLELQLSDDDGHGDDVSLASEFFAALLAQKTRWDPFIERGAKASVPQADRRYTASSNALLTMFMNTFR